MSLIEIKGTLKTSSHPVARALHKGEDFKVIALGMKKGMTLKEHKTHVPTKLFVLEGSVIYREEDKIESLLQYNEINIPVNVAHSVEAVSDCLCLLTQG